MGLAIVPRICTPSEITTDRRRLPARVVSLGPSPNLARMGLLACPDRRDRFRIEFDGFDDRRLLTPIISADRQEGPARPREEPVRVPREGPGPDGLPGGSPGVEPGDRAGQHADIEATADRECRGGE